LGLATTTTAAATTSKLQQQLPKLIFAIGYPLHTIFLHKQAGKRLYLVQTIKKGNISGRQANERNWKRHGPRKKAGKR